MKAIMKQRDAVLQNQVWNVMMNARKFSMKKMYLAIQDSSQSVAWKALFYGNLAQPKALINLWLACNERLATRDRLHKYGLLDTIQCCLCSADETQLHLMFSCNETKSIWRIFLEWILVEHNPLGRRQEMELIIHQTKGKGGRAKILKLAFTESVYVIQRYKNDFSFGNVVQNKHIDGEIIDTIVYRGWTNMNLKTHLAKLMMY